MLNKPAIGQIGLIYDRKGTHRSFVAKAIDWVTRSPVHHVIVCVSEDHCVEAQPGGAVLSPLSKWPNAVWSNFPLTPAQAEGTAQWAIDHIGTPYGFLDDAAIGIGLLLNHWAGFELQRFLSSDHSLQCAQLADAALTKGGKFKVFDDNRLDGAVYPGSFVPLFKKYGWWPE